MDNIPADATSNDIKDIAAHFESIGDNCEFGLYQRHLGLEPLSLFRFSSTTLPHLLNVLATRFDGVGNHDCIRLHYNPEESDEYLAELRDDPTTYQFLYRTGTHRQPSEEGLEAFENKLLTRQSVYAKFLARKFIETLETGHKLLMFKQSQSLTTEEIDRLYTAIQHYGPSILLVVRPADDTHEAGEIVVRKPRLLVGYISKIAPRENVHAFDAAAWEQVCRAAYAVWTHTGETPASPVSDHALPTPDTELFMQFESLGDTCEFGLIQRHFGAEPISLLRWNAIDIDSLTNGIANNFEHVESQEESDFKVNDGGEYILRNHRYGMVMHTFIKAAETSEDPVTLLAKMCRYRGYLARKLMEDMRDPNKIFVYKTLHYPSEKFRQLHAAMALHGNARLLCGITATAEFPAGSLIEVEPGLYVGATRPWLNNLPDYDGWRALCRNLLAGEWQSAGPDTLDAWIAPSAQPIRTLKSTIGIERNAIEQNAWDAHRRNDWQEAINCWEAFIRLDPHTAIAHWMLGCLYMKFGRNAEADATLSKGVRLDPGNLKLAVEHAKVAAELRNWPEMVRRWDTLLTRAPESNEVTDAHAQAVVQIQHLRQNGELDSNADGVDWDHFLAGRSEEVVKKLTIHDEFEAARAKAWDAHKRLDWLDAINWWQRVIELNPSDAGAYWMRGALLLKENRPEEAEAALSQGVKLEPGNLQMAAKHAQAATDLKDWAEALRRWDAILARDSQFKEAIDGRDNTLILMRSLSVDAATDTLSGITFDEAHDKAWAAHKRLDWENAIDWWDVCIRLNPSFGIAYWMRGRLLLKEGRTKDAEAVLSEGVKRDPDNIEMAVDFAAAATNLGNWSEALRRWNALLIRAPARTDVIEGRGEAVRRIQSLSLDENIAAPGSITEVDTKFESSDAELLMQFESLGNNCEFGLVQRHFGVEPISLLRWNSINIDALIDGISCGFAGIGDPEQTDFLRDDDEEYVVRQRRFHMAMHSFIYRSETKEHPERIKAKLCHRMTYLANKLMDDLRSPSKIFVRKDDSPAPLEKVIQLHQAMERYSQNRLLYVVAADDDHPKGSVVEVTPRLYVGAVSHLPKPLDKGETVDFSGWRTLCRKLADGNLDSTLSRNSQLNEAIDGRDNALIPMRILGMDASTAALSGITFDEAHDKAWAAHKRLDWKDAIDWWDVCIQLNPSFGVAYWMRGTLLLKEGRANEAEGVLSEGIKRDPNNLQMAAQHAQAATDRQEWVEALSRWDALLARDPTLKEAIEGRGLAVMRMRSLDLDQTSLASGVGATAVQTDMQSDDANLFMQFESLGDNCEFGLVQRKFGIEPISLLRWNAITIDALISGINQGFESVGERDTTELAIVVDEYVFKQHRFGLVMHTFLNPLLVKEDAEQLAAKLCRRMVFLAGKLMDDLRQPSKIFVYKTARPTSLEKMRALHAAMEQYGKNRLLVVIPADAEHPAGSVIEIAPRLYIGGIDHFVQNLADKESIDYQGWQTLCHNLVAGDLPHAEAHTTAQTAMQSAEELNTSASVTAEPEEPQEREPVFPTPTLQTVEATGSQSTQALQLTLEAPVQAATSDARTHYAPVTAWDVLRGAEAVDADWKHEPSPPPPPPSLITKFLRAFGLKAPGE